MFDDDNRELMMSLIDAALVIALLIEIAAFTTGWIDARDVRKTQPRPIYAQERAFSE